MWGGVGNRAGRGGNAASGKAVRDVARVLARGSSPDWGVIRALGIGERPWGGGGNPVGRGRNFAREKAVKKRDLGRGERQAESRGKSASQSQRGYSRMLRARKPLRGGVGNPVGHGGNFTSGKAVKMSREGRACLRRGEGGAVPEKERLPKPEAAHVCLGEYESRVLDVVSVGVLVQVREHVRPAHREKIRVYQK